MNIIITFLNGLYVVLIFMIIIQLVGFVSLMRLDVDNFPEIISYIRYVLQINEFKPNISSKIVYLTTAL